MQCPKCASVEAVKNGKMNGKQRYKCKCCGCNFTKTDTYHTPLELRRKCLSLYLEGVGFRGISRLTGVSHVTVMKWVKKLGQRIEQLRPKEGDQVNVMELDELWHFVKKSPTSAGSGLPMTETERKSTVSS